MATGRIVGGALKPSTDNETHRLLYQSFPSIGGVTHTHSTHAVAFAQANLDIPVLGTTHADTFNGPVCCTRQLTVEEVSQDYELNTGKAIVDLVQTDDNAAAVPGALAVNHGPFLWGPTARKSLEHAIICEAVAEMAILTLQLNPKASAPQHLLDRHFTRKHGPRRLLRQRAGRGLDPGPAPVVGVGLTDGDARRTQPCLGGQHPVAEPPGRRTQLGLGLDARHPTASATRAKSRSPTLVAAGGQQVERAARRARPAAAAWPPGTATAAPSAPRRSPTAGPSPPP